MKKEMKSLEGLIRPLLIAAMAEFAAKQRFGEFGADLSDITIKHEKAIASAIRTWLEEIDKIVSTLLENNGGPIDGIDGKKYVMVVRKDFEDLELARSAINKMKGEYK